MRVYGVFHDEATVVGAHEPIELAVGVEAGWRVSVGTREVADLGLLDGEIDGKLGTLGPLLRRGDTGCKKLCA